MNNLVLMSPGLIKLSGFPYSTEAERTADIAYYFSNKGSRLAVFVDLFKESVDPDKLLEFLKNRGVIPDIAQWLMESIEDTAGFSFSFEDDFTTVVFIYKS